MTQETPLTQEVVTMLMDAGYPKGCVKIYSSKGSPLDGMHIQQERIVIFPSQAVRWLREDKGLSVYVAPNYDYIASQWIYEIFGKEKHNVYWLLKDSCGGFNGYDTALLEGIKQALTILNQQNNDTRI